MPEFDTMAAAQSPALEPTHAEDVEYWPLDVEGNKKTIQAVVFRSTRRQRLGTVAVSERIETMEVSIRAEDNANGHVTPVPWISQSTKGDRIKITNKASVVEDWYVRAFRSRDAGGRHLLLVSTSPKPFGEQWSG